MKLENVLNSTRLQDQTVPQPSVDFDGVWRYELDSVMDITVDPSGVVKGTYQTGVGSPKPSEKFLLTGYASGDLISFVVNFGKYGSLTCWAGQHTEVDENSYIRTLWHLVSNIPDASEPRELWSAILAGADEFYR